MLAKPFSEYIILEHLERLQSGSHESATGGTSSAQTPAAEDLISEIERLRRWAQACREQASDMPDPDEAAKLMASADQYERQAADAERGGAERR